MAKSIMQKDDGACYLCGANGAGDALQWHHVFGGANRRHSEKYGLKVRLCGQKCHESGTGAVHVNREADLRLKAEGQAAFERQHGTREDFMRVFGRNWR